VQGVVDRGVGFRDLTLRSGAEALAENRSVSARPELLAGVNGIRRGMAPSRVLPQQGERYHRMARLLLKARAAEALIAHWTEGQQRAEDAKAIPRILAYVAERTGLGCSMLFHHGFRKSHA
jgi:hypothetical protein